MSDLLIALAASLFLVFVVILPAEGIISPGSKVAQLYYKLGIVSQIMLAIGFIWSMFEMWSIPINNLFDGIQIAVYLIMTGIVVLVMLKWMVPKTIQNMRPMPTTLRT